MVLTQLFLNLWSQIFIYFHKIVLFVHHSFVCSSLNIFSLLAQVAEFSLCLYIRVYSSTLEMSQHGDFNALMQFNGELTTVTSWLDDGERDHNSVTLKTRQWRGNVAVLSQTLCGDLSDRDPVFRVAPATVCMGCSLR